MLTTTSFDRLAASVNDEKFDGFYLLNKMAFPLLVDAVLNVKDFSS